MTVTPQRPLPVSMALRRGFAFGFSSWPVAIGLYLLFALDGVLELVTIPILILLMTKGAEAALAAVAAVLGADVPILYARVDVVDGPDGTPMLLELELVEPSLFLPYADGAAARFVEAARAAAGR